MENTTTTRTEGSVLAKYAGLYDRQKYLKLHEEMGYEEYLQTVLQRPKLARNAFQYVYDMIMEKGTTEFQRYRRNHKRYNFFIEAQMPIKGLEETLEDIVDFIHGAAGGYGTERRILLLHGPVGSSKSTICRVLKRGLEKYSKTDDGAWYTYKWVNLPIDGENAIFTKKTDVSPLNEDPIKLMPHAMREEFMEAVNRSHMEQAKDSNTYRLSKEGDLNPRCKKFLGMLLEQYDGDWQKVMENHVRVVRRVHSEIDRVGIGTFQPKDEKNQDSTELSGDMNFSQIGHFGSDSDPRAFNFDGEFCVSNRGMCEFIEMLKLDNAFLYDLLGASQEHQIKPKKFSQVVIDELIIAHTNNPEYEKMKGNRFMEALRDRTIKVDVPYLLRWDDELAVYEHDYGPNQVRQHVMPHTLEIAAFFAILTRLHDDTDSKLDLRDKVKLYNGRTLPGWTEDSVKELRDKFEDEGMKGGISARYVQDKISNCLARHTDYINVFHLLNELREGLPNSSSVDKVEDLKRYEFCVELAIKELDDILKAEVQKALSAGEEAIKRLCTNYIDNVIAYVNNEKVVDPITGERHSPNERLMRSIEEKDDIPEQGADDFRRSMAAFIGSLSVKNEEFKWDSNPRLKKALEAKAFEDVKDSVKIASLTREAANLDPELQEKLDAIKTRLIQQYGYNDQSATDVLEYVSGIFARGDVND